MPREIKKMQFEVDWVKIWLEENEYSLEDYFKKGRHGHVTVKINSNNQLTIESSGRVVKTPTYLGGITPENFDIFYQEIRKLGIIVSKETLLNARITQLDVKRDIHWGKNTKLSNIISSLRERAISNSSRFHMILFNKRVGVANSLLIKSRTKTVVDSLTVYNKFEEMYVNRKDPSKYWDSFNDEFKDSIRDVLRFERRIKRVNRLRKALHLDKKDKVNLKAVFDCKFDILFEKIDQHFDIGGLE
ncbi:hypothetical protein IJD34_07970 [bacterium]|nr:hypothetical protein [bacterium]